MSSLLLICLAVGAADPAPPSLPACKALVGQWRGVGQVRRGSTRGAWQVQGEWKWSFPSDDDAKDAPGQTPAQRELVYSAKDGKYVQSARLLSTSKGPLLKVDGASFRWEAEQGRQDAFDLMRHSLVFVADEPLESGLARITLRLVASGDRLLMRLDRRRPSGRYSPLGEVGFTRIGSGFGQGGTYVECVVTGGLGTIAVKHQGKTYYVCCTGCKEYFEADPDGVLAEYRKRKAEEREQREKQAK